MVDEVLRDEAVAMRFACDGYKVSLGILSLKVYW